MTLDDTVWRLSLMKEEECSTTKIVDIIDHYLSRFRSESMYRAKEDLINAIQNFQDSETKRKILEIFHSGLR